jgi:hypothetical protein
MSVITYHGLSDVILNVNGHITQIAECVVCNLTGTMYSLKLSCICSNGIGIPT